MILAKSGGQVLTSDGMIDMLAGFVEKYPNRLSIEDGLAAPDWVAGRLLSSQR